MEIVFYRVLLDILFIFQWLSSFLRLLYSLGKLLLVFWVEWWQFYPNFDSFSQLKIEAVVCFYLNQSLHKLSIPNEYWLFLLSIVLSWKWVAFPLLIVFIWFFWILYILKVFLCFDGWCSSDSWVDLHLPRELFINFVRWLLLKVYPRIYQCWRIHPSPS